MGNIREAMEELIDLAKSKNYSKESVEIIGTIVCSETAMVCGYKPLEGLRFAIENIKRYDNERDCINALIEVIK